jgi:hypothetical protein
MKKPPRFPLSMKALRAKYPKGTLVQTRFILPDATIVEYEGVLNEGFDGVMKAVKDQTAASKDKPS